MVPSGSLLFMAPGSTVVEILHHDQKGRVYGGLASALGHRFIQFEYDLSAARGRSQLDFARSARYSSFVLDVPTLLGQLDKAGVFDVYGRPQKNASRLGPRFSRWVGGFFN